MVNKTLLLNRSIIVLLVSVTIFLLTPGVLSNGLLVNQSDSNTTKIYGNDVIYNFNITNTDSFTFFNISIETNDYVTTPKIDQLSPGQTASVNSLIISNNSFDTMKFKIKGFYYANVGVSYLTHNITVDYYNGLSRCDFSIIKGDKINWINLVSDDVDLKNAVTGNIVTTIHQNDSYLSNFDNPEVFKYLFLRRGFGFTPVCTITVLNDNGLINNPELDGNLTLSLNVIYNPTNISLVVLENNYTSNVFQSQDGVLTITNVGNQTARNINLTGEWFTFNTNNFNLEPGITKGIVYTIKPYLIHTEDTNKSYTKTILISGNFLTQSRDFNIFVNYAVLNDSNLSSNYQSLLDLIKQFCKDNPDETFCKDKPTVVYVGNGSDGEFNVTFSQQQVKSIFSYIFSMGDDAKVTNNYLKDSINNISKRLDDVQNISLSSSNQIEKSTMASQVSAGSTTLIIIIFIMIAIGGLLITIILVLKRYKKSQEMNRW